MPLLSRYLALGQKHPEPALPLPAAHESLAQKGPLAAAAKRGLKGSASEGGKAFSGKTRRLQLLLLPDPLPTLVTNKEWRKATAPALPSPSSPCQPLTLKERMREFTAHS